MCVRKFCGNPYTFGMVVYHRRGAEPPAAGGKFWRFLAKITFFGDHF